LVSAKEIEDVKGLLEKIFDNISCVVGVINGLDNDRYRIAAAVTTANWIIEKCTRNPAEEAQVMMMILVRYFGRALPSTIYYDAMVQEHIDAMEERGEET
jgi:hypothetical protein